MPEILTIVDQNDNPVGQAERSTSHQQGLWHRRVSIFVFNSKNELLIQKRAPQMARPNLWCASASGHVLAGETYEQAARRELREELGIECDLKFLGKIKVELKDNDEIDRVDKEFHQIYTCVWDGDFNIQHEELSDVHFFKVSDLKETIKFRPEQFTPGFRLELEYYLKHKI